MTCRPEIVIATGNAKKGGEMAAILGHALRGLDPALLTLADFPGADTDLPETGATFAANAEIKARAAAACINRTCIADDGGLEIDALGGQPGLQSRRFLGDDTPFTEKMSRILELMRDVPDDQRSCRFRCAVAICTPDGRIFHCEGACEGRVAREQRGTHGFGYDPIVYLPELGRHMAELRPDEKHRISHRGRALACAVPILRELLSPQPGP